MFKKNKTLWLIVALVAVVAVVVLILCLRGCGSQTEPDNKTVQTQDSVRAGKANESDNKANTKSGSDKTADKSGDKTATDKTADKDTAAKNEEGAEQKQGSTSEEKNSSTSESENHTSTSDGNESSGSDQSSSGESYSEPEPVYTPTPQPEPVTPVHTHSYTNTVIAPSCTTNGYTVHTCDCGDSYRDSNVSAWGHDLQPVYETRTVEVYGEPEEHAYCNGCGEDVTSILIGTGSMKAHFHETGNPNCMGFHTDWITPIIGTETEQIITGYVCSRCGETKKP